LFCSNCGIQLEGDDKFCSGCGSPVAPLEESPLTAAATATASQHAAQVGSIVAVRLRTLLFENPFETLGLPPDTTAREVRRQIEQVEMDGRLGRKPVDQGALTRAAQVIEDPRQRIDCEALAHWSNTEAYGHCADEHDYALEATRKSLIDTDGFDGATSIRVIRAWAGVVRDPDVVSAVNARLGMLGLAANNSHVASLIGSSVIPPLVRASLDSEGKPDPDLGEALSAFGMEASEGAAVMLQHVQQLCEDPARVDMLTVAEVEDLVDSVIACAKEVGDVNPRAAREMIEIVATAANSTAWTRANRGNLADAQAVLEDLAASDLPKAIELEIDHDLVTIREAMAHREAQQQPAASPQGASIKGAEGLTVADALREVQEGGRFVMFEYVISLLVLTSKRPSEVYFIRAGESHLSKSIGFILLTLLFGWWGIPWGPIYTLGALFTDLKGGHDVTSAVLAASGALNRAQR